MTYPYELEKNLVKRPTDVPACPHWAIVLYETVSYNSSGYSAHEGGGNTDHLVAYHFVYTDESAWQAAVVAMATDGEHRSNRQFTFFKASGRGHLAIKVNVTVESTL